MSEQIGSCSHICVLCGPAPTGPRRDETHVGVRFGDKGLGWSIFLNGEKVERVYECYGTGGWVVVYRDPIHLCGDKGGHGCAELLYGEIQLVSVRRGNNNGKRDDT